MSDERKLYEDWLHRSPEFGEKIVSAWDVWQARAALSAPAGWQPISTAPKDGSQFLIWTNRIGFAVVAHDQDHPMPTDLVPSGHHLKVDDGKHGPYSIRGDYPTHWLSLPATPSPQEPQT